MLTGRAWCSNRGNVCYSLLWFYSCEHAGTEPCEIMSLVSRWFFPMEMWSRQLLVLERVLQGILGVTTEVTLWPQKIPLHLVRWTIVYQEHKHRIMMAADKRE
ncbi:uncharacterized protein LOC7479496 [Populus trichocarpa]|uniref:uncharacterized protein LOC7479496 n=1 Tax=Populus trichocarpa TaxID=3694 RepID=UPI002277B206|nr:uncharacterized protein LOC7479496 [Populus trichocarpa]